MSQMYWFIVAVSVLPNGNVSISIGPISDSFETKAVCEKILWDELDRGYMAGYVPVETEAGLQLVLSRKSSSEVLQCISPWTH